MEKKLAAKLVRSTMLYPQNVDDDSDMFQTAFDGIEEQFVDCNSQ